jgi:hypothetical protein
VDQLLLLLQLVVVVVGVVVVMLAHEGVDVFLASVVLRGSLTGWRLSIKNKVDDEVHKQQSR